MKSKQKKFISFVDYKLKLVLYFRYFKYFWIFVHFYGFKFCSLFIAQTQIWKNKTIQFSPVHSYDQFHLLILELWKEIPQIGLTSFHYVFLYSIILRSWSVYYNMVNYCTVLNWLINETSSFIYRQPKFSYFFFYIFISHFPILIINIQNIWSLSFLIVRIPKFMQYQFKY